MITATFKFAAGQIESYASLMRILPTVKHTSESGKIFSKYILVEINFETKEDKEIFIEKLKAAGLAYLANNA